MFSRYYFINFETTCKKGYLIREIKIPWWQWLFNRPINGIVLNNHLNAGAEKAGLEPSEFIVKSVQRIR